MLLNYFKSAYLHLLKHKHVTVINIAGLVVGMSSCMLILLFVLDEISFDDWISDARDVYRYELGYRDGSGDWQIMRKSALRARRDLLEYFPAIEQATRIIDHQAVLSNTNEEFFETVWFVDPEFSQVFDLTMLAGSAADTLETGTAMLLSESMARKYFGGSGAAGQTVTMDNQRDYLVGGVFQDTPARSHVAFDFIVPYDESDPLYHFGYSESWGAVEGYTYLKLADGADSEEITQGLGRFLETHMPEGSRPADRALSEVLRPRLLNVQDIHLDPGGLGNIRPPGNSTMLFALTLIAILVLVIACINFVNLSGVRLLERTGEMSVRKAMGAQRGQIALQFLFESVLVSLIALFVSVSLVELLLPLYGSLLGREISTDFLTNIILLTMLACLAVFIGVLTGLIPALRLSRLEPVQALRGGRSGLKGRAGWLQQGLVMLQFAISATLILSTLVVLMQQWFMEDKDLGFSPDNKLVIRNLERSMGDGDRERLATELQSLPSVDEVTFSVATPSDTVGAGFTRQVTIPGHRDDPFALYPKAIAPNFFSLYGIELLSGRGFSGELASDAFYWPDGDAVTKRNAAAILNETAVTEAGFASPSAAIGNTVVLGEQQLEIVGVVRDFHFRSLREVVTPNLYLYSPAEYPNLTLAYGDNVDEEYLVEAIAKVWEQVAPGAPLAFEYIEENLQAQYAQDRRQFLLMAVFSSLAIVIACMGLYALSAFTTRQRNQEIGIRKVHGALERDIVKLFLFQFSKPVLWANLLSWPFAAYAMNLYLNGFQYRIDLDPSLFLFAGFLTLAVAWFAVIVHTLKAASRRPVLALRYE